MASSQNASLQILQNISSDHRIRPRHLSFVNDFDMETCYLIPELAKNQFTACHFVAESLSCNDTVKILNYLKVLVCDIKIPNTTLGAIQICLIMLFCVVIFATFMFLISRFFILPNIVHVAHYMHIPLYQFGSTIIAVIMSTPEIVWVFNDCKNVSKNSTILLANMLGKAFMTFNIGLSVVCLGKHIEVPGFQVVKHILMSSCVLALSYVLIFTKLEDNYTAATEDAVFDLRPVAFFLVAFYISNTVYTILTKRRKSKRPSVYASTISKDTTVPENGWRQLLHALNPFNHLRLPRFVIFILLPFWVVAAIQIPVIDKQRHNLGWCKYLTCINIVVFPWLTLLGESANRIHIFIALCCISLVLVLITMFSTNTREPPAFQGFYAVLGIVIGFYNYYVLEGELETILWQTFSYVFNAKRDITMLTGFVFHNLLNLVLITQELVILGLGNLACGLVMGLVINQAFLMLPIITFQSCYDHQSLVAVSANTTTCFIFMMLSFAITLLSFTLTNFKLRQSQGIYLISFYIVFYVFLTLSAFETIHPYGGFHSVATQFAEERNRWA